MASTPTWPGPSRPRSLATVISRSVRVDCPAGRTRDPQRVGVTGGLVGQGGHRRELTPPFHHRQEPGQGDTVPAARLLEQGRGVESWETGME